MFEVQKSVPMPEKTAGRGAGSGKYPFRAMSIGDSFVVPVNDKKPASVQATLMSCAGSWAKLAKLEAKFTTRQTGEGIRVWQIA